jgi:hypothetical protein
VAYAGIVVHHCSTGRYSRPQSPGLHLQVGPSALDERTLAPLVDVILSYTSQNAAGCGDGR